MNHGRERKGKRRKLHRPSTVLQHQTPLLVLTSLASRRVKLDISKRTMPTPKKLLQLSQSPSLTPSLHQNPNKVHRASALGGSKPRENDSAETTASKTRTHRLQVFSRAGLRGSQGAQGACRRSKPRRKCSRPAESRCRKSIR